MPWGWRGLKTCHVIGGGGGYFSARGEKFGNDNTVRGVNCVLRVEGVEKKICPEGGGGIEKNNMNNDMNTEAILTIASVKL